MSLTKSWKDYPYCQLTSVELDKKGIKWFCDNEIPVLEDDIYIVNYNNQHWYLVCVQFPNIFCYCSYGAISKWKDRPSKTLMKSAKAQGFKNIYVNDDCNQPPQSWLCGYMDLVIYDKLKKQHSKLNWDKFRNIINGTFTKKASDKNVYTTTKVCKRLGVI